MLRRQLLSYGMRVNFKKIACCIAILFVLATGTSAADNDYIIGKEADKNLLTISIVFVVLAAVLLLVTIVIASVTLTKKKKRSREVGVIDSEEESGQSEAPPAQFETLKINESGNGVYQSIDSKGVYQSVDYEQPNGEPKTKQGTPPGTEKEQKDSKESEKPKTLSSFQNPAYEASVPYGLDKEVEFKPVTSDDLNEDTAL